MCSKSFGLDLVQTGFSDLTFLLYADICSVIYICKFQVQCISLDAYHDVKTCEKFCSLYLIKTYCTGHLR